MGKFYDSLEACQQLKKQPLTRGKAKTIFADEGMKPMYSCAGVQPSRNSSQVLDHPPFMSNLPMEHWKRLLKMVRWAETVFESFADAKILRHIHSAKEVVPFKTFRIPGTNCCSNYFGGVAFGPNVFLRCHTDEDFTLSVAMVLLNGEDAYHPDSPVVAHFCFPTEGFAVPMRPGSFLLFDATVPHAISSRSQSSDTVMCISFYLKSKVVGLNNNSLKLTKEQELLASLHSCMLKNR